MQIRVDICITFVKSVIKLLAINKYERMDNDKYVSLDNMLLFLKCSTLSIGCYFYGMSISNTGVVLRKYYNNKRLE